MFAALLLIVAVALGGYYRFHRLARWDINGDEAVAWMVVTAPSVPGVIAAGLHLEKGGKLPFYHLLLHGWMGVFGGSLYAMRAMSAALGTAAIVLLWLAVREVCRSFGGESAIAAGEVGGAFAALIYALNVTMVQSDRTAREFAVLIVAELVQITFFARAQRRRALVDYAGVVIFTAAMFADNYSSAFLLAAEALWLAGLLLARSVGSESARRPAIFGPGLATAVGVGLLAPLAPLVFALSRSAMHQGYLNWVKLQPPSWPFAVLRDAAMTPTLCWLFIAMGAFGIWRGWRSGGLAFGFFAAWMMGPLLAVLAVSYLVHPMEFPRYVLIALVGMFAFAGAGAGFIRSTTLRIVIAALIIHWSVPQVRWWLSELRGVAWREATAVADQLSSGGEIAVFPPGYVKAVRFYLAPSRREAAVSLRGGCLPAPVLILSGRGVWPPQDIAAAEACYPHLIKRLNMVEVREH